MNERRRMNRRGLTRVDGAILLGLAAISAALFLPTWGRSRRTSLEDRCATNLRWLWKMQNGYRVQFGGPGKEFPHETGAEFWLRLSRPPGQVIDAAVVEIYRCPLAAGAGTGCDYRGPASDANALAESDVVGADRPGNHGTGSGGHVLRKGGDVTSVAANDPLWSRAERQTK